MININRHNYEEIFIDYLDGNLDYHDVAELMLFLSENPDLDAELDGLQAISINNKPTKLPIKHLLKKEEGTLSGFAIDDKCIAKLEGDLSKNELKEFNSDLFNDEKLRNNLLLVLKTKLKKDKTIVYPFKDELKKQNVRKLYIKGFYKYAAIFLPAIIFSILYLNYSNNSNNSVNNNQFTANNSINKQSVSSSTKKDINTEFKIVKIETPSIVSQSVHLVNTKKQEAEIEEELGNRIEFPNENIVENPKFENENIAEVQQKEFVATKKVNEKDVNTYFNTYDIATNEIKSDEQITRIMEQYKSLNNDKLEENSLSDNNSTFGESVAETFSELTSVFQFDKEKVDDGKVYRLAFNSRNFEIGRIKKKKK